MSLRHPSLHNALCKRRSPAPCRAPSVSQCIGAHLWVYVGNLRRLIEEHKVQYLPPEMFPAQWWKAVGPWPRPCPPLAASITLSHAPAQLFSRATQTDKTTSVSHMKKAFIFCMHIQICYLLCGLTWGSKEKYKERKQRAYFVTVQVVLTARETSCNQVVKNIIR